MPQGRRCFQESPLQTRRGTRQVWPFRCRVSRTRMVRQLPAWSWPLEVMPALSWPTLAIGGGSIAVIKLWPKRWGRFVPGSFVAVIVGTLVVYFLKMESVATIGSRFGAGAFPNGLPEFKPLDPEWSTLGDLIRPAVALTLLGAIESLLSAVVSDGMIDDRHDSNQELMGQGIANMTVPFFAAYLLRASSRARRRMCETVRTRPSPESSMRYHCC